MEHPTDAGRSYLKDLGNMLGEVQNKMKNSSTPKQYLRSDISKIMSKLKEEYGGHKLDNDQTGKLLK